MSWLQLSVDAQRQDAEEIEKTLLALGALSVTFCEHIPAGEAEQPILEPGLGEAPLWQNTQISALFNAQVETEKLKQILKQTTPAKTLRWALIEDKDWQRQWMENYHPIQCAPKLWICPSWREPPDSTAVNILLDPGLAFGTGTHPTTFLCLQWLASIQLKGQHVLDYGCGSGILGVAAHKLGAASITGVDIDPQALIASQENAVRNHITASDFPVYTPENFPNQGADILVANILAAPLVTLADTFIGLLNPAGQLCLSGILQEQIDAIIHAYHHEIDFHKPQIKEGWACLSGTRRE